MVNFSMVAGADLEHPVGKVYKRNLNQNDNVKIEVIYSPHYSSPPIEYNYIPIIYVPAMKVKTILCSVGIYW